MNTHRLLIRVNENRYAGNGERKNMEQQVKLRWKVEKEKHEAGKQQETVDDVEKTAK